MSYEGAIKKRGLGWIILFLFHLTFAILKKNVGIAAYSIKRFPGIGNNKGNY